MTKSKKLLIVQRANASCPEIHEAAVKSGFRFETACVNGCPEMSDFLFRRGAFERAPVFSPNLVLIDLDSVLENQESCLREVKSHEELRRIPIIGMIEGDGGRVSRLYDAGLNSVISRPGSPAEMVERLKVIHQYWFENVELPII